MTYSPPSPISPDRGVRGRAHPAVLPAVGGGTLLAGGGCAADATSVLLLVGPRVGRAVPAVPGAGFTGAHGTMRPAARGVLRPDEERLEPDRRVRHHAAPLQAGHLPRHLHRVHVHLRSRVHSLYIITLYVLFERTRVLIFFFLFSELRRSDRCLCISYLFIRPSDCIDSFALNIG